MTLTYQGSGVDYGAMDPFKRMAQLAGRATSSVISRLNGGEFKEYEQSRGESAYLIEAAKSYFAHVEEGLGTKNLVADAMYKLTGKSYYDNIAQDTVAMIVNDMITLGAMPLSVAMHLAVGDSSWFKDEQRVEDLIQGWQRACLMAGAVWGGGETPTLKGVIIPGTVVLSGSAIGLVKPKERLITHEKIQHGDAIVLFESSGIHANGLTLARQIADRLPKSYLTDIGNGRTYGDALLEPTIIYVRLIEAFLNAGIDIHYVVNITGHGWRKLMRAPGAYSYIIEKLPKQQMLFDFIQEHGPVSDHEAFGNLNMGAGLGVYVNPNDVSKLAHVLIKGWAGADYPHIELLMTHAGYIERSEEKRVVIHPKGIEFKAHELGVR